MQDSSTSAIWMAWHLLSTLPKRLWDVYITHLFFYQPQSLIGRLASTFRVLAFILILPVVLLTLLDVSSYVIARTLGVVDDAKADADVACTCARRTACTCPPRAVGVGAPARMSDATHSARRARDDDTQDGHGHGDADGRGCDVGMLISHPHADLAGDTTRRDQYRNQNQKGNLGDRSEDRVHACYFAGEGALRLAGEGVFSPAVSGPPSPVTPRTPLCAFTPDALGDAGVNPLRRRAAREDEPGHS